MGVYAAEETSGFAHEALTIDNTAGGIALTAATYAPAGAPGAVRAVLTLETAQIRWTYDGTAPTTTVGHLMETGEKVALTGAETIARFRAIRTGGTSGVLHITYER